MSKPGRNEPCPCGIGKKYKHCHGAESVKAAAPEAGVAELVQTALQYHRAGRLVEAETLYRQVLARDPQNADATHLMGMIAHQGGRHAEAVELITRAIEANGGKGATAYMHNNLGEVLSALQRIDEAIAHYRKAIALNDRYVDGYSNLGVALTRAGRFDEAEAMLKRAIALDARAANPQTNLGNLYQEMNRYDDAIAAYRLALAADPNDAKVHNNLGNALKDTGKLDSAVECYQRAIALQPNYAEAQYNLGVALWKLERLEAAEAALRKAIALRPEFGEAYSNLGEVLRCLGRIPEAEASFTRALDFESTRAEALGTLGTLAYGYGSPGDAYDYLQRALAMDPERSDFHKSLGAVLLLTCRFAEGWEKFDSRWHIHQGDYAKARQEFKYPWWTGRPLAGKTLLVWGEQGVGDEIWAAGMYRELIDGPARGERVLIECRPKLFPLFKRSFTGADVIAKLDPPDARCLNGVDFQIACGSLGRFVRPDLASFPRREATGGAYLFANPVREAAWRKRIASLGPGLKVGICWRSTNIKGERALSCTRLMQWGEVFKVPGVRFISVQYDECEAELAEAEAAFGVTIERFPEVDMYDDLDETAALMRGLDLVISAPTSVSILSAALGVPTWQMNHGVEWQLHGLDHNPWYPSMRNYARRWDQPWEDVLAKIAVELGALAENRSAATVGRAGIAA